MNYKPLAFRNPEASGFSITIHLYAVDVEVWLNLIIGNVEHLLLHLRRIIESYSYFLWKISRQMAPANAIGTPIRAGKLYPNPIATGIPPRKAPMALPRLKAP